jgi:phosphatidylglycerol---prolipoprotein diacylglyceryl transferase
MIRELFRIPGLDIAIYGYGLMLMLGALLAIWLSMALARRRGLNPDLFLNAGLLGVFAGVVGARAVHVLENLATYFPPGISTSEAIWGMINIREGGLVYYGGVLGAAPVLIFYAIRRRIPVRTGMDLIAPALMIGLAFGRIGCFLNGCCFGGVYDGPGSVQFPYFSDAYLHQVDEGLIEWPDQLLVEDARGYFRPMPPEMAARDPLLSEVAAAERSLPVHPTQIYSSVTAFLIAFLLLSAMPFIAVPGRVFALMLLVEPVTRFALELLRTEPAVFNGMSLSMVLAIPQYLVGVALWVGFGLYYRREKLLKQTAPTSA